MAPNHKRSWFEALPVPVEFLEADFTDFRYPRHVHETFAIGIIERGAQRFASKRGQMVMPAQRLCIVDPDVVHWGWPATDAGWRYRMFYPPHELIADALDVDVSSATRLGFGEVVVSDTELFSRFAGLHRRAALGDRFGLDEAVFDFVRELVTRHAPIASRPPIEQRSAGARRAHIVRDFLHDRLFDPVTLAEMGEAAGVSATHVGRTFRLEFGMSPYAYLLALRVERSKAELATGASLVDVATRCGFHDQPHFHRTFRRIVGVTPGEFVVDAARN